MSHPQGPGWDQPQWNRPQGQPGQNPQTGGNWPPQGQNPQGPQTGGNWPPQGPPTGGTWPPQPPQQPRGPQTGGNWPPQQPQGPQTGGNWPPQQPQNPPSNWPPQPPPGAAGPQTGGHWPPAQNPQPGQWNQPQQPHPTQQWPAQHPPTQQWPAGTPQNWGAAPAAAAPVKTGGKRNMIIAMSVVVVLLAAAGVWWFAIRDTAGGKDTPQAAATALFADINNGDIVALTDSFAPAETALVRDISGDVLKHFQRIGLVTSDATLGNSTGSTISIKGITFDDAAAEKPLDDLTIVKLTGGTITITPAPAGQTAQNTTELFTRLKDALATKTGAGIPKAATEPTVIDIAQVIKDQNDGKPFRFSIIKVDGAWYPSIFYTVLDYWNQAEKGGALTSADAIPAAGATSPEKAVEAMIGAIAAQSATDVIKLLPPDEMAAVHAYGQKIGKSAGKGSGGKSNVTAEWVTSDVTGGKLVSVKSLTFTDNGDQYKITIDKAAGVATVEDPDGKVTKIDADYVAKEMDQELADVHPNFPDFVNRMLKAAMSIGLVTTQVNGSWYVSPVRSATGVFTTLLGGVEKKDVEMLIDILTK